jgi:hypothetical protein
MTFDDFVQLFKFLDEMPKINSAEKTGYCTLALMALSSLFHL